VSENLSIKHVRRNCIECSDGSAKYVTWCPCDGKHSTRCEYWLFRFGVQPGTFRKQYGPRLLDPEMMPPADINLDLLPQGVQEAATAAIDIGHYRQPAIHIDRPQLSPEKRRALAERFRPRQAV